MEHENRLIMVQRILYLVWVFDMIFLHPSKSLGLTIWYVYRTKTEKGGQEINCRNVSEHANKSVTFSEQWSIQLLYLYSLVYILDVLMHTFTI